MKMIETMKMMRMLSAGLGTAERAKNEKEVSVNRMLPCASFCVPLRG